MVDDSRLFEDVMRAVLARESVTTWSVEVGDFWCSVVPPDCDSYAWLGYELRKNTPDVERPDVRANRLEALRQRPFHPTVGSVDPDRRGAGRFGSLHSDASGLTPVRPR
jgi:hypothetical protein